MQPEKVPFAPEEIDEQIENHLQAKKISGEIEQEVVTDLSRFYRENRDVVSRTRERFLASLSGVHVTTPQDAKTFIQPLHNLSNVKGIKRMKNRWVVALIVALLLCSFGVSLFAWQSFKPTIASPTPLPEQTPTTESSVITPTPPGDEHFLYFLDHAKKLYKWDTTTEKVVWEKAVDDRFDYRTMRVQNGKVYDTFEQIVQLEVKVILETFDATNGTLLSSKEIASYGNDSSIQSIGYNNNDVYICSRSIKDPKQGEYVLSMQSNRLSDGAQNWIWSSQIVLQMGTSASVMGIDGRTAFLKQGEYIAALNLENGHQLWEKKIDGLYVYNDDHGSLFDHNVLYTLVALEANDNRKMTKAALDAYNPNTGELLWRKVLPDNLCFFGSIRISEGKILFVADTLSDTAMALLDPQKNGDIIWQVQIEKYLGTYGIAGDILYGVGEAQFSLDSGLYKQVYAYSLKTGEKMWEQQIVYDVLSMYVHNGILYLGYVNTTDTVDAPHLFAETRNLSTGEQLKILSLEEAFSASDGNATNIIILITISSI